MTDLLQKLGYYRREASWAVWELDESGQLAGVLAFPLEQAQASVHGRAMFVSLNPGSDRATEAEESTRAWSNFHSPARKHNDIFIATALVDTPFWGGYMVDLHPSIAESDSRLVRSEPQQVELAVRSLIQQAELLGSVETIVCVGSRSYESVRKHSNLLEAELGLTSNALVGIPHYSRANARIHGQDAQRYRVKVHEMLGRLARVDEG